MQADPFRVIHTAQRRPEPPPAPPPPRTDRERFAVLAKKIADRLGILPALES